MSAAVAGKAVVAAASAKPGLSPEAEKFLDQVSGGARREVGAWIGDHFLVRRLKAQLKLLERAHQYLRDAGRDPREVKWNVLFPLLEAASLDEDDDMADRWAALLANAADPLADEVPPSFADVLRQLTPLEARILVRTRAVIDERKDEPGRFAAGHGLRELLGIAEPAYDLSVENLFRLRLLRPPVIKLEFTSTPELEYQLAGNEAVQVTGFGRAFLAACERSGSG